MAEAELSDEQATKLEQDYLDGKFTEAGPVPEEAKEEVAEEEEEEKVPSEEGPAIKENQRLRQKNREVTEQMESLQNQLEALSARVTESSAPKKEPSQIEKASTDDLLRAETQVETKLYEAIAQGDSEAVQNLTEAKSKIKAELVKRPAMEMTKHQEEEEARKQWTALEELVVNAVPDIKDKSSAIYKAAEEWAGKNKALMKAYGDHLGGVLATAQALILSKSTTKQDKQAIKSVTKEMEKIAESSVSKSGSTATPSTSGQKDYLFMSDEDFEKSYEEMLAGNAPIP